MPFKHKGWVFFVAFCLLAGVSALAAQERGSVRGVVKDTQGNTLEGAKASIVGSTIPQGRDYVTKKDGVFLFQAVPPGAYTVLVTHPSMADFAIEVLVNVDRQTAVNVEMSEVGRVSEEVTVQAVSPVIDLKSTEVSASWQKDLVEKLPMGRSYASLFQLAPGVADNRDFAPNAGGNKQDNVYLYDGSNITNPLFGYLGANFSEMDIQEVNIKRGGISAEFGRAAGMVTNAITKSGSNTITGSVRFVFEPSSFQAAPKDWHASTIVTPYDQSAPAIGVGGPLIKDRLFWYVSGNLPYSRTSGRINNLGAVPNARTTSREFFGKITANPFKAHLFSLSVRNNDYTSSNGGVGVNDAPSVAVNGEGSDWILFGSWVWTISQSTLLEARYDHVKENYSSVPITDLGYRPAFDLDNLAAMGYFRTATGYHLCPGDPQRPVCRRRLRVQHPELLPRRGQARPQQLHRFQGPVPHPQVRLLLRRRRRVALAQGQRLGLDHDHDLQRHRRLPGPALHRPAGPGLSRPDLLALRPGQHHHRRAPDRDAGIAHEPGRVQRQDRGHQEHLPAVQLRQGGSAPYRRHLHALPQDRGQDLRQLGALQQHG